MAEFIACITIFWILVAIVANIICLFEVSESEMRNAIQNPRRYHLLLLLLIFPSVILFIVIDLIGSAIKLIVEMNITHRVVRWFEEPIKKQDKF